MSGTSSITLYRTADTTMNVNVWGQQAALMQPAQLTATGVVLRMDIRQWPNRDNPPAYSFLTPREDPMGVSFEIVEDGLARMTIYKDWWVGKPGRRYSFECFVLTPTSEQRAGEVLVDLIV